MIDLISGELQFDEGYKSHKNTDRKVFTESDFYRDRVDICRNISDIYYSYRLKPIDFNAKV